MPMEPSACFMPDIPVAVASLLHRGMPQAGARLDGTDRTGCRLRVVERGQAKPGGLREAVVAGRCPAA